MVPKNSYSVWFFSIKKAPERSINYLTYQECFEKIWKRFQKKISGSEFDFDFLYFPSKNPISRELWDSY